MESKHTGSRQGGVVDTVSVTEESQNLTSTSQTGSNSNTQQSTTLDSIIEKQSNAPSADEAPALIPPVSSTSIGGTAAPEKAEVDTSVEGIDENLDQALGHAADSIWSFASAVTGTVTSVVKDGQPGFENFRKNVTSRLAPLDTFGRDLSSQIGALAPDDASLAKFTGSMKSVAETVQRNAEAMEAAILSKANGPGPDNVVQPDSPRGELTAGQNSEIALGDPAVGLLTFENQAQDGGEQEEEEIDVNEEIAKVGETIQNSLIGQTVGDLWTGLWGMGDVDDRNADEQASAMPQTRFEKRIFELQANPDTYCEPAKDLDSFAQWSKGFVLDDHAESCIAILDTHDSIADLYERVVPRIVDEDTFWMRYFFAKYVLEREEERRKKLLERAENTVAEGEEDDGWGDDDWGDENDSAESRPLKGSEDRPAGSAESLDKSGAKKETVVTDIKGTGVAEAVPGSKTDTEVAAESKLDDDWGEDDWE